MVEQIIQKLDSILMDSLSSVVNNLRYQKDEITKGCVPDDVCELTNLIQFLRLSYEQRARSIQEKKYGVHTLALTFSQYLPKEYGELLFNNKAFPDTKKDSKRIIQKSIKHLYDIVLETEDDGNYKTDVTGFVRCDDNLSQFITNLFKYAEFLRKAPGKKGMNTSRVNLIWKLMNKLNVTLMDLPVVLEYQGAKKLRKKEKIQGSCLCGRTLKDRVVKIGYKEFKFGPKGEILKFIRKQTLDKPIGWDCSDKLFKELLFLQADEYNTLLSKKRGINTQEFIKAHLDIKADLGKLTSEERKSAKQELENLAKIEETLVEVMNNLDFYLKQASIEVIREKIKDHVTKEMFELFRKANEVSQVGNLSRLEKGACTGETIDQLRKNKDLPLEMRKSLEKAAAGYADLNIEDIFAMRFLDAVHSKHPVDFHATDILRDLLYLEKQGKLRIKEKERLVKVKSQYFLKKDLKFNEFIESNAPYSEDYINLIKYTKLFTIVDDPIDVRINENKQTLLDNGINHRQFTQILKSLKSYVDADKDLKDRLWAEEKRRPRKRETNFDKDTRTEIFSMISAGEHGGCTLEDNANGFYNNLLRITCIDQFEEMVKSFYDVLVKKVRSDFINKQNCEINLYGADLRLDTLSYRGLLDAFMSQNIITGLSSFKVALKHNFQKLFLKTSYRTMEKIFNNPEISYTVSAVKFLGEGEKERIKFLKWIGLKEFINDEKRGISSRCSLSNMKGKYHLFRMQEQILEYNLTHGTEIKLKVRLD